MSKQKNCRELAELNMKSVKLNSKMIFAFSEGKVCNYSARTFSGLSRANNRSVEMQLRAEQPKIV